MKRNRIRKHIITIIGFLFFILPTIEVLASPSQSTYTPQVEFLMILVIGVSLLIAGLVFGLLIYILIRFREGVGEPVPNN